jgi:hypothetical protein
MESKNYYTDKREFCVRFVFRHKADAVKFRLPMEYRSRFELNERISEDGNDFIRVAQIKYGR